MKPTAADTLGASAERGANRRAGILIVDDNPKNLVALRAALEGLDARLVAVDSGSSALRQLLQEEFAVVILDVRMPAMDGLETARLIRSRPRTAHVPIIFITAANPSSEDVKVGYEMGAADYLFRPVVPEILRAKAQVFIDLHEQRARIVEQATRLREMEIRAAESRLEEERAAWEQAALNRRMEEQREINARLELADRRKDEFIAMLAHELRNPLAPLSMGLEILDDEQADDHHEKARTAMRRQLRHLTRLVDDLLDVSRISNGKLRLRPARVLFSTLVDAAVEACRADLETDGRQLVVSPPETEVELVGDEVRLTQVLSNLLGNAAKYTGPGGRTEIAWHEDGDDVVVTVSDDGQGVAPEFLERIFEKFAQERDEGPGLGLGLTLSRHIVALHGGELTAHSAGRGRGTELRLCLPRGEDSSAERGLHPDAPPTSSRRCEPVDVVVIDDEADVRDLLQALLECWGHRVRVAASGEDGLAEILERPPDVALLDVALPDIRGPDVARRVCDRLGDARPTLVALTGFGDSATRARIRAAGFDAHLIKPVDADRLQALLRVRQ